MCLPRGGFLDYIEYALAKLFINRRGYEDDLFYKCPAFAEYPEPNLDFESPDCGPSYSRLRDEYSMFGAGRMPEFKWNAAGLDVKEYLLISEDVDAPMGHANVHGIYCFIPGTTVAISPRDFEVVDEENGIKHVRSGFRIGKNRRSWVYVPPRPPIGHGPHRYFFELVALKEPLKPKEVSSVPTKQELIELVKGKVAGWGSWVGIYERKWK